MGNRLGNASLTEPYDATIMGDYAVPADRAASVTVPTLVLAGDASFPIMRRSAEALPNGKVVVLDGQTDDVPRAVAPVLQEFVLG